MTCSPILRKKFSLTGLFQRMDNFRGQGLDDAVEPQRRTHGRKKAELETVKATLGKELPQRKNRLWRGKTTARSSGNCSGLQ